MDQSTSVLEYKCPCCNAGLRFSPGVQKLKCEYCDNSFELETVEAFNAAQVEPQEEQVQWEPGQTAQWSEDDAQQLQAFQCPSCGGELLCEATTAASFCPYCGNPTVLPTRLTGGWKPDLIIPFQKTRADAQAAFLALCKGKPLLPREFTQEQQLEKITGMYVPFWLYDCQGSYQGTYHATRVRTWSDRNYCYTKTDHYQLRRAASASFVGIPMDGSAKMDDTFMESIEPYDYAGVVPFEMGYLSGYLADKYDIPSADGEARIRQRVKTSLANQVQDTLIGYQTAVPSHQEVQVTGTQARYALMPVWMLNTKYRDKIYTFAMNGQTGKMTGQLPICPKRSAAWFGIVCAGVTALSMVLGMIF